MDSGGCKPTGYLASMIIVLIFFVAALGFALWYYFAQLKPRLDMLVMDKLSGSVGFKDSTNTQLLLVPTAGTDGRSSRISVVNPQTKSNLDFQLFTVPIAGNTKQQVQLVVANPRGSAAIPLTTV